MTEVTEMCPHCQNEVTVQWDVENDGYELYCPYCGFPIMLCSMCDARDGKVCDWEEIKGCKHSDERYRDYFYKNLSCENAAEIARSSRDNDGWIPVEGRMPEAPEENPVFDDKQLELYLVCVDGGSYPLRAFWNGKEFTDGWSVLKVIAWMPLPEPYNLGMVKKQTNADRIRAMSDEDLAINMMCPNENGLAEIDCDKCDNCNCYECLLKWLQSEVEE